MKSLIYPLIFLSLFFSQKTLSIELLWNTDALERFNYKSTAEIDITGALGDIDAENWISQPSKFEQFIQKIQDFKIDEKYLHYRTTLNAIHDDNTIRVRMVGVPRQFRDEPVNDVELELRQRVAALTDAIMLQGDIDLSGDSAELTFYRPAKERNILTQFFYLPKNKVKVGDRWELPVNYIELGPGFFVQDSSSYNAVTLKGLKQTSLGTVAEIQYLIFEKVEGYVERVINSKKGRPTFSLEVTSVGYGEFLVEQGYWLRQTFVLSYSGTGSANVNRQHLFALVLDSE